MPLLKRDDPKSTLHLRVDDADDTFCNFGLLPVMVGILGEVGRKPFERRPDLLRIEPDIAAQKEVGIEAPQEDVGVGDRHLLALPVADRTRFGSGATGSDLQQTSFIDPGNRTAAGADGMDSNGLNRDGMVIDHTLVGRLDAAVAQADIGGGPPHIQRNDLVITRSPGNFESTDDTPCRPGKQGADGLSFRRLGRDRTSIRLHDGQRALLHELASSQPR